MTIAEQRDMLKEHLNLIANVVIYKDDEVAAIQARNIVRLAKEALEKIDA